MDLDSNLKENLWNNTIAKKKLTRVGKFVVYGGKLLSHSISCVSNKNAFPLFSVVYFW